MDTKRSIAFVVPAHNEARVIAATIEALLSLGEFISADDIYVGNDNSSDDTSLIARKYTQNVHDQVPNVGKATILNTLISKYDLVQRYKYIMPVDADTRITREFVQNTLKVLEEDTSLSIICAVGKVVGKNASWVTSYRIWEYEIGQLVYKRAQSLMNVVLVCPGCSTVYRSSLFEHVAFPTGTVTEDMDLTFHIHRSRLGRIVFVPSGSVITQDPKSVKDYVKQVRRWYKGFWQAVVKHNFPWGGQLIDAEVMLLATEGLFNGILVIALLITLPLLLLSGSIVFLTAFMLDLCFFLLPTMLYVAIKHRIPMMLLFLPHFYFMRVMASLLFISSFFSVIYSARSKEGWVSPTRYKVA